MREYSHHHIYIAYPENWVLEETDFDSPVGAIQLSNENGAFWFLKKYPFGANPDEIANEAVEAMRSEYDDMEVERVDKVMSGKTITGYEITFFYLDLMNVASILCFEQDGQTLAVFWQTGNQLIIQDDEIAPTDKVLEAITLSLIYGKNVFAASGENVCNNACENHHEHTEHCGHPKQSGHSHSHHHCGCGCEH
ncbi:hypothetical protein FACS189443_3530 [Planctomycetales bacterium]|nr:hypothetical protein FACS189443_3530 [Planctomycetales bacterium]